MGSAASLQMIGCIAKFKYKLMQSEKPYPYSMPIATSLLAYHIRYLCQRATGRRLAKANNVVRSEECTEAPACMVWVLKRADTRRISSIAKMLSSWEQKPFKYLIACRSFHEM